jgi:hypothetical protein
MNIGGSRDSVPLDNFGLVTPLRAVTLQLGII